MKGALIIFIAMIVIGIVLYAYDVLVYRKKHPAKVDIPLKEEEQAPENNEPAQPSSNSEDGGICCGMHTVCEKTNLSPITGEVVYYDDEELDRFRGRNADEYTPEEIEEFRDVLLTLLPEDVAGWSRSIQVRGITLPTEIRDELLMIVGDLRGL